ncbi:MAG: hypothetical protein RIS47_2233, partial [Bacteroidota bacterium]|jgi:pectinesterase
LHVDGDEFVAKNCKLLGNQDTLFTGNENSCQLYLQCEIEGTTDFIFGPATCWFEDCVITSRKNSWITAASTPQTNAVGYVFNNCKIKAKEGVDKVFLGRPWRAYAAVVFMHCELGAQIDAAGWENWKNTEHDKTARYAEYQNTGAGAKSDSRVGFAKQLTKKEAKQLSMKKVFAGWSPKM